MRWLALAQDWQPELVLLDAHMPDISGTEVCRRLSAHPQSAAVPVVLISALPSSGIELLALELGAAGFLSMPLDEGRLLACIQQHLPRPLQVAVPPAEAPPAPDLGTDADTDAGFNADPKPCLPIFDDDPSAVQAVHAALSRLQARFVFATDGQQALTMARQHRPAVILLDLYMLGLDGLDTLRELKADPELADQRQPAATAATALAPAPQRRLGLVGGAVNLQPGPRP